jgi:hypothetical protein
LRQNRNPKENDEEGKPQEAQKTQKRNLSYSLLFFIRCLQLFLSFASFARLGFVSFALTLFVVFWAELRLQKTNYRNETPCSPSLSAVVLPTGRTKCGSDMGVLCLAHEVEPI